MKLIVEEYGRLFLLFLVGIWILWFFQDVFVQQMKRNIGIPQGIEKERTVESSDYRKPEFAGLEKDGKPLAIKIPAGSILNLRGEEGLFLVQATDARDGDLTDRMHVCLIEQENEKEKKIKLNGSLEASEQNKQYILEYSVKNSAGFECKKRISVLTDGTGGET